MAILKKLMSFFWTETIDITGSWTGHYGFSQDYPESYQNKKVQFFAVIKEDSDGSFKGTIKESEEGIPEVSMIEGNIRGRRIQFVKTYAHLYEVDKAGKLAVLEGPQQIIYNGSFNHSLKMFIGDWKIESIHQLEDGSQFKQVSTGGWSMTKDL